jgi:starch phosphorylase
MVKPVATVDVIPNLPPSLERLRDLAYNLRWSWDHETIALFRRLDRDLWDQLEAQSGSRCWSCMSRKTLQAAAEDEAFLAHLDRVCSRFDAYMHPTKTWYQRHYEKTAGQPIIAYFSMEYGRRVPA